MATRTAARSWSGRSSQPRPSPRGSKGEVAGILGTIGLTGPGLPGVLRLLEDGRLDDLARPLFPDAAPEELENCS